MIEKESMFLQYVAVSAANLNTMACGAVLGWTSPALVKLSIDNPILEDNPLGRAITKEEGSWIGSLTPVGVMCGSVVSSYFNEWIGRKKSLLVTVIPLFIGWIVLGTATSVDQIYIGRFILGVGLGISFASVPMYTGEISNASIRGTLGTLMQVFLTLGFLLSYCIGPYTSYTFFWIFCLNLYVIFFLCFIFMPESPYFFISKGKELEAAEALGKFRGLKPCDVNNEIKEIKEEIEKAYSERTTWKNAFKNVSDRKSVIIMTCMLCFIELMGIDCIIFYAEDIFRNAGTEDTALCTIIVGLVQVLATVLTAVIVDISGRKILLIISSIGAGISVGILSGYFYLQILEYDLSNITWIPLASLIGYITLFSIGWGPLPWTMMGEMFSPAIKSKATCVCIFSINLFSFLMTKCFATVEQAFGTHVCFLFFTFCCVLEIIFIISFVPETKGKTLAEIQRELSGDKRKSCSDVQNRNEIHLRSGIRF